MDFFELPPPVEEPGPPSEQSLPPWFGPSDAVLGAAVAIDPIALVRTEELGIGVTNLIAHPSGVEFRLSICRRQEREDDRWDPHSWWSPVGRPTAGGLPPELLRFGVQFADGRKATNTPYLSPPETDTFTIGIAWGDAPTDPVLQGRGGSGSRTRSDQDYWLWPLPPPGPLAFVCEWPSQKVDLARVEIDAAPILEAAARALTFWDELPS